jgi:hypothetical protein
MVAKLVRAKQLRDAFPSEVKDLAKWIAENIDEINSVTGLNLSNVGRERAAGDFSVDLIAEDDDGGIVVIENQLGRSDHDHLGKLITYMTAFDAKAAVWVVEEPRVEHINAIAWLNQSSSAEFYVVKMEAVKIAGSDWAPLITLIVGPSDEAKDISAEKEDLKLRHIERKKFREGLLEVANKKSNLHSGRSPTTQGWIAGSSGTSGIGFNYVILQHSARVEVWIARGTGKGAENKAIFDAIKANKTQIESAFGQSLDWQRLDQKDTCRICADSNLGGYRDPDKFPEVLSGCPTA